MTTAYLALGANLGDRAAAIDAALARLDGAGVRVAARSPLYETDPVAPDPQPRYLNAAARVETALSAARCWRPAWPSSARWAACAPPGRPAAPRVIDVDLLLYGDASSTAPHPARPPPPPAGTPVRAHPAGRRRRPRPRPPHHRRGPRRAAPSPCVALGGQDAEALLEVRRSSPRCPSSSDTCGAQLPSSCCARAMSGLRRVGSSLGSGAVMISRLRLRQLARSSRPARSTVVSRGLPRLTGSAPCGLAIRRMKPSIRSVA